MAADRANPKETVAILGPGKVGTAVGHLLRSAGYEIVALASRSAETCNRALPYTGGRIFSTFAEAALQARTILITVSDDAIRDVCQAIAPKGLKEKKVIHMSGAGGLDLLEPARLAGASVGCIHPIQTFAGVDSAIETLPGTTFGITADPAIRDWAVRLVKDLGGRPFFVSPADKPLYHAAACMASNYLVALMNMVEDIYGALGLGRDESFQAFWPLVRGTIRNIEDQGTLRSLTGPVARGDAGTIEKHLEAFRERLPALLDAYCLMGLRAADIAVKKGSVARERAETIKTLLKGGIKS